MGAGLKPEIKLPPHPPLQVAAPNGCSLWYMGEGVRQLSEPCPGCQLSGHHRLGWEIRQVAGKASELCLPWPGPRPSINKQAAPPPAWPQSARPRDPTSCCLWASHSSPAQSDPAPSMLE